MTAGHGASYGRAGEGGRSTPLHRIKETVISTITIPDVTDLASQQLLQPRNRYPLFDQLASQPVSRLADGTFAISGCHDITQLPHDYRISADRHVQQTLKAHTVARGQGGSC